MNFKIPFKITGWDKNSLPFINQNFEYLNQFWGNNPIYLYDIVTEGVRVDVTAVTDTYTVPDRTDAIICNKSTAFTVTLPAATGSGRRLMIKSIGVGAITIAANTAETIDGSSSQIIYQYECIQIIDNATDSWAIV